MFVQIWKVSSVAETSQINEKQLEKEKNNLGHNMSQT